MQETSRSILAWGDGVFGPISDRDAYVERIKLELEELAHAMRVGDGDEIGREAADVVILLHRLAATHGKDLNHEVDLKMAINRARRWETNGSGVGRHIKE